MATWRSQAKQTHGPSQLVLTRPPDLCFGMKFEKSSAPPGLRIADLNTDGLAFASGLKLGEVITSINGIAIGRMSYGDALSVVKNCTAESVHLTVQEGQPEKPGLFNSFVAKVKDFIQPDTKPGKRSSGVESAYQPPQSGGEFLSRTHRVIVFNPQSETETDCNRQSARDFDSESNDPETYAQRERVGSLPELRETNPSRQNTEGLHSQLREPETYAPRGRVENFLQLGEPETYAPRERVENFSQLRESQTYAPSERVGGLTQLREPETNAPKGRVGDPLQRETKTYAPRGRVGSPTQLREPQTHDQRPRAESIISSKEPEAYTQRQSTREYDLQSDLPPAYTPCQRIEVIRPAQDEPDSYGRRQTPGGFQSQTNEPPQIYAPIENGRSFTTQGMQMQSETRPQKAAIKSNAPAQLTPLNDMSQNGQNSRSQVNGRENSTQGHYNGLPQSSPATAHLAANLVDSGPHRIIDISAPRDNSQATPLESPRCPMAPSSSSDVTSGDPQKLRFLQDEKRNRVDSLHLRAWTVSQLLLVFFVHCIHWFELLYID